MVASMLVEISTHSEYTRQRGSGFGSLAQVIGRIEISFSHDYIVSVAKRMGADLLECAVPEPADFVSG